MRNINEHEKALNLFYHDGIGYKRIAADEYVGAILHPSR